MVKNFATTSKDVSDLPYKILYNYYTIEFKRNQLRPENYVTGNMDQDELDQLAEDVITRIERMRKDYYEGLRTAGQLKTIYELLQPISTRLNGYQVTGLPVILKTVC
ncbi:MAG: hypothetical protein WDN26_01765 [Chitinophagaceae bacterium]